MTVGRNDPCPCGSGKKHKKCCGADAAPARAGANDLTRALSLLQGGHPGEALAVCMAILRDQPQHPGALELAGMIHYESREFAAARQYFERLVAINPKDASGQANLAQVLSDLGDQQAAEEGARRALALDARHAGAHNLLGNLLGARGAWDEALRHYRQAVAGDPQRAIFHHNLGHALQQLGKEEAEVAYRQAIEMEPRFSPAYANLGGLLVKLDRCGEARDLLRRAVDLDPANIDAYNNLGLANRKLGDLTEAYGAYRVALEKNPKAAGVWHNLGVLYEEGNRRVEAIDCFKRAVELDPEFLEAQRDWLHLMLAQGDLDSAHALATRVMSGAGNLEAILPKIIDALGRTADFAGRERAIELFRRQFQNGQYPPTSLALFLMPLLYPEDIDESEILNYHLLWGTAVECKFAAEQFASWPSWEGNEPLRIGYLSPDFRGHSVGYFIQHILAHHDRQRFDVYCYANQRVNDGVTERIRASVAKYTEVRDLTDQQLAKRIHDDGIHILVDLAGHTAETRLDVLVYRPAPVQITWIGYPHTTGLNMVDYRISDPYVDLQAVDAGTEALLRLPESFLCFGQFSERPVNPDPPCREKGYVTFASFNNLSKLNAGIVRLWSVILNAVPGSRLLIKAGGAASQCVRAHLDAAFAQHGIAANRVLLAGHAPKTEDHLDLYNTVDIALDTFPYHGATTTCEALWMGVPVVTRVGDSHRSRVGLSLLTNIGLPGMVAESDEQYVQLAVSLANDPVRLKRLRTEIPARLRQSILCDPARFTRQLEDALTQAWQASTSR